MEDSRAGNGKEHETKVIFTPLPDPRNQIRLFRFQLPSREDGDREDDTIECRMKICNLHEAAHTYAAISYTWGTADIRPGRRVLVDEKQVANPRDNLWYALWQMRHHNFWQWYWIDGLCINQDDDVEKAEQVGIMHCIYGDAACTAACVSDDETMLEELLKSPQDRNLVSLRHQIDQIGCTPYMERLWVVPEILLAQRTRLFCGKKSISWDALHGIIDMLSSKGGLEQLLMHQRTMVLSARSILIMKATSLLPKPSPKPSLVDALVWSEALRDLFIAYGQRKCCNPLDKIYTLIPVVNASLSGQPCSITIDYKRSRTDLALRLLGSWLIDGPFQDRWKCALRLATELDLRLSDIDAASVHISHYGPGLIRFRWDPLDERNIRLSRIVESPEVDMVYYTNWQSFYENALQVSYGSFYQKCKPLFHSLRYLCFVDPTDPANREDPLIAITACAVHPDDHLMSVPDMDVYAIFRRNDRSELEVVGTAWRHGDGVQRVGSSWFGLTTAEFVIQPTSRALEVLRSAICQHQGICGVLDAPQHLRDPRLPFFQDLARQLN